MLVFHNVDFPPFFVVRHGSEPSSNEPYLKINIIFQHFPRVSPMMADGKRSVPSIPLGVHLKP